MNWGRLLVAALGVAAFGVAAAAALVPGVASMLPVDAAVAALGLDYLLVAVLGVVALVVTLLVLALRAVGGQDQADPPAPESIETVPRLGADVDAVLEDGLGLRRRVLGDGGEPVRERFRETAVRTVARVENCEHAEARRRVRAGTWTDDAEAAAFLADGGDARATWRTRVYAALQGESPFQRGARRAVEAVVALAAEAEDEYADVGGSRAGDDGAVDPAGRRPDAARESSDGSGGGDGGGGDRDADRSRPSEVSA